MNHLCVKSTAGTRTERQIFFLWESISHAIVFVQTESDCAFFSGTDLALPRWQVSGSVLSVYSGDFGSVDAQGTVEFALDYDEKNREFQVHVSQCRDLAVVDEKKGRSDPWVMF